MPQPVISFPTGKILPFVVRGMLACLLCLVTIARADTHTWQDDNRVLAFGDVHGGYSELINLLRALKVIDSDNNWSGGTTHLVSLGDLLDRGPDSRQVMDLLIRLQQQATSTGGYMHLVLGNHEVMNLTGDLRYVAGEEYAAFAADETPDMRKEAYRELRDRARFNETPANESQESPTPAAELDQSYPPGFFAHRKAFSPTGKYGRWLLAQPQVIVINGTVFLHGGLSPAIANLSIEQLNKQAHDDLTALLDAGAELSTAGVISPWEYLIDTELHILSDDPGFTGSSVASSVNRLLELRESVFFSDLGPTWYRGTAYCHRMIEEPRLKSILEALGVQRVVMGHTPTSNRRVQQRFDGTAILADTGMLNRYYNGQPSAVEIRSAGTGTEVRALYARADSETRLDPTPGDLRTLAQPDLESALTALDIDQFNPEEPNVIDLRGKRYSVVFHPGSRKETANRVAAYRLDRQLGLGLVPVTVAVKRGTLDLLPAKWITESDRLTENLYRPDWCQPDSEFQLMYAFDALQRTEARTSPTIVYDRSNWDLYLTGNGRTFGASATFPGYLRNTEIILPRGLADQLATLSEENLTDLLGDLLNRRQIKSLYTRSRKILDTWAK